MSAVRTRMTMRAHVQRNSVAALRNEWNSKPPHAWDDIGTVPCYAWAMPGAADARKTADDGKVAVVEHFRMITPLGADLTDKDRISRIVNRRDAVLFDGPLTVDVGRAMSTHREWDLGKGRPV